MLRWLGKRIGRAPVFYTTKQSNLAIQLLENRAINQGHFYSRATYTTDTLTRRRSIRANYVLRVGTPYTIEQLLTALGHDVRIARRGLNTWEILEGSAHILISYH